MNRQLLCAALGIALLCSCNRCPEGTLCISSDKESVISGLHAPWDSLEDDTHFSCLTGDSVFKFVFEVNDSTLTVNENPQAELDLLNDDRVEIFFSADSAMTCYYGAEMTPAGHTLDYKAKFYRDIDYAWNFSTLKLECEHTDMHYTVSGSIDLQELESMGLNLKDGFYMGVFRADYRSDGSVNWYSAVKSDDESPDFHKPDMLFKAAIR